VLPSTAHENSEHPRPPPGARHGARMAVNGQGDDAMDP
jgi:hypothetical protein